MKELSNFFKKNLTSNEIIIGMGAGIISKWMRELEFSFMSNLNFFLNKFDESLSHNVKLANYSWFNLGGDAKYFFKPKNKNQLLEFLTETKKNNIETIFLGAGSNTLFRDNGVKGAVIKLGKSFSYTKIS